MTTPITTDECRELAESLGIEWHEPVDDIASNDDEYVCFCGAKCMGSGEYVMHLPQFYHTPDFTDARVPLRLAMEREDWKDFHVFVHEHYFKLKNDVAPVSVWRKFMAAHARDKGVSVPIELMLDHTGQLAKLLLEWLRGREK